uniref:MG2 domain-containing protein n=1 Tax=Gongylonema pulchrum TaxID=637853 RepID=A0A183ECL9_9BILA
LGKNSWFTGCRIFIFVVFQNPDGFELVRKTVAYPGNRFYAVEFLLPEHLNFGEWQIVAVVNHHKQTIKRHTYSVTFNVQNYEVPIFRVHVLAKETSYADLYELDVIARQVPRFFCYLDFCNCGMLLL